MNRALLDNWSTREQLCLASAVACSGDQNWVSISNSLRNIKTGCSNNTTETTRPSDWFSQKSCALQYAHLLGNGERPTDSVLRRLTEQRIEELKSEIRKDQEEYAKIHAELQRIQSPLLSEDTLRDMWHGIEQEEEAQRIAEMKLENQIREREQRKNDTHRNWRMESVTSSKQENTAVVDMDVEEIIGVSKPIIPAQQQQQQQTATSPLLSSLLKSSTATVPVTLPNVASSVRAAPPTIIHTLLTSGSIPNDNQPAITLNSDLIPPEKAVKLLTRPISGPPVSDLSNVPGAAAHNLLSPSQSAPTLSMLLEKNKTAQTIGVNQQAPIGTNAVLNNSASTSKAAGCNKQEEPMEIEEDVTTPHNNVEIGTNADTDEPDPNEEQQLMEVFKNIGNIELDIDVSAVIDDEEVDFLKGVDEESPAGTVESMDFENKIQEVDESHKDGAKAVKRVGNNDKDEVKSGKEQPENQLELNVIKIETSSDDSNDNIPLAAVATLENKERSLLTPTTEETEEKSNENDFLKSKVESAITSDGFEEDKSVITTTNSSVKVEETESIKTEQIDEQNETESSANLTSKSDALEGVFEDTTDQVEQDSTKEKPIDEGVDEVEPERFATPIGDEKLVEKELQTSDHLLTADEDSKSDAPRTYNDNSVDNSTSEATLQINDEPTTSTLSHMQDNTNTNESAAALPPPPLSHISVADTDEDSCTTDISVITTATKREEKQATSSNSSGTRNTSERGASQTRKGGAHDTISKSTEDSDSSSGHRISKRSLLSILNNLSSTKSAQTIHLALTDEQLKYRYQKTCYRRLDFQSVKKSIENGAIRSVIDLQRDLLQLAQNVNFLFHESTSIYKAAEVFKHEMQNIREFIFNAHEFEAKTEKEVKEIKQAAAKQGRTGSRKSLRIS